MSAAGSGQIDVSRYLTLRLEKMPRLCLVVHETKAAACSRAITSPGLQAIRSTP